MKSRKKTYSPSHKKPGQIFWNIIIIVQLTQKFKYEIIVKSEMGNSIRQIASDLGICKDTVSCWLKKYEDTGFKNEV